MHSKKRSGLKESSSWRAISATKSSFLRAMGFVRWDAIASSSCGVMGTSFSSTAREARGSSLGTCTSRLKMETSWRSSRRWEMAVVPKTSSRDGGSGGFLSRTSSVCRMRLLNLGPRGVYSMRRSRSSSTMTERGDLEASWKTFWMCAHFCISPLPMSASAAMNRTKGMPELRAVWAARAVLPVMFSPSSKTESSGVFSDTLI
mmetsp:Transcript_37863/g.84588  ORF Transcript_37863/g.84588 Transcript_37863/m.84588 type:complete len:203 (-) Transcript_37863:969-1577(-)